MSNLDINTSLSNPEETPYNSSNILFEEKDINNILSKYGISKKCKNIAIYRKSMCHRSYITRKNENFITGNQECPYNTIPLQEESNERFEFVGDAVIKLAIANYLYKRYPASNEGFLTKMRSNLENGHSLGFLARKVGLPQFVIISKQIDENGGRDNYKILEDAFEAFVCAIYFDFDNETATEWVLNVIETHVDFAELIMKNTNYKDKLVKYYQHNFLKSVRFLEQNIRVKNNKKLYTIIVKDDTNKIIGKGQGNSRKEAEQSASKHALENLAI